MTSARTPSSENEEFWRHFLTRGSPKERRLRRFFNFLPTEPRCSMCAAPFGGAGAPLMRLIDRGMSDQSPKMCNHCFTFLAQHHGGAEIECSFLFADVRGSTTLAEKMPSAEFRALLDRYYTTASKIVFAYDGGVDKFVGDELVAMFFPLLSGEQHTARAVDAALALLGAVGHSDPHGPWLPIGAGVHTGPAWVGAVGEGPTTALTALGDTVNTTARLAAAAGPGEILVSADAATAAGLDPTLERRSLSLKGRESPIDVVSLTTGSAVPASRAE